MSSNTYLRTHPPPAAFTPYLALHAAAIPSVTYRPAHSRRIGTRVAEARLYGESIWASLANALAGSAARARGTWRAAGRGNAKDEQGRDLYAPPLPPLPLFTLGLSLPSLSSDVPCDGPARPFCTAWARRRAARLPAHSLSASPTLFGAPLGTPCPPRRGRARAGRLRSRPSAGQGTPPVSLPPRRPRSSRRAAAVPSCLIARPIS